MEWGEKPVPEANQALITFAAFQRMLRSMGRIQVMSSPEAEDDADALRQALLEINTIAGVTLQSYTITREEGGGQ